MAKVVRERVTVDIRGLAPALKAQADAWHLTVSQVTRLALVAALPPANASSQPGGSPSPDADRLDKLTIRRSNRVPFPVRVDRCP